jgi:hypothetical protein
MLILLRSVNLSFRLLAKTVKIKIFSTAHYLLFCRSVKLGLFFFFKNNVLRRAFGPKREEGTRD